MSEKIEDVHAGLITALTGDADLDNWSNTHFGQSLQSIKANTPLDKIDTHKLPGIVFEIGDSGAEIMVSGAKSQVQHEIPFTIIWIENDAASAWTQRLQVHDLVIKALLANDTLGLPGVGAWVSEAQSDNNVFHPKHLMRFIVSTEFLVDAP